MDPMNENEEEQIKTLWTKQKTKDDETSKIKNCNRKIVVQKCWHGFKLEIRFADDRNRSSQTGITEAFYLRDYLDFTWHNQPNESGLLKLYFEIN